jgi:hypothetical protein
MRRSGRRQHVGLSASAIPSEGTPCTFASHASLLIPDLPPRSTQASHAVPELFESLFLVDPMTRIIDFAVDAQYGPTLARISIGRRNVWPSRCVLPLPLPLLLISFR